mgnify:CR=1 FL=1
MLSAQKKFEYLQEMGIELWQLRTAKVQDASQSLSIGVDQDAVTTRFFSDVLQYFNLTIEDIIVAKDIIHLNQLKWQFSEEETFDLQGNKLITPALSEIASSITLKKALWQTLSKFE